MKTTRLALLALLFIVSPSNILPGATQEMVLDSEGNILEPGAQYYVLPHIWGPLGGGLALKSTNNSCEPDVVSLPSEVDNGVPVRIWSWNRELSWVPTSTDLKVHFVDIPVCGHPIVWKVKSLRDEATGLYFVTVDRFGPPRSCGSITRWFKIEKVEGFGDFVYKFVYCPEPEFCPSIQPICKDLGVYYEDWSRRLFLSDEPHKVVFVKVKRSSAV